MPIQIGKYKRPGIFIEEFDSSVIASPATVEGISTLVMGFSTKGPANTPVLLNTLDDAERIYGPIDRNLERKGSYFHRTIAKLLESGPVQAMNLLLTDINDNIEYVSISSKSDVVNGSVDISKYDNFFDRTSFWKRDTAAFLNIQDVKNETDKLLHFANMSDKAITVFVFKSKRSGFDTTLLEWYGSIEKVPTYLYAQDYASDYMVDVVVAAGDWTDYQSLSVDNKWKKYFNKTGIIKEQVRNFTNDRNVTTLAFYEGLSLIPYFKDANNKNIFIETVINKDVNKTGLFVAFNSDILETDNPNGSIDIIGNNLIKGDTDTIDFLSYKESIVESVTYPEVLLDRVGNVISVLDTISGARTTDDRTALYAEGYVDGVTLNTFSNTLADVTISYTATSAYSIVNDVMISIPDGTFTFSVATASYTSGGSGTYSTAIVLDETGTIKALSSTIKWANPATPLRPAQGDNDIVLGYFDFNISSTYSIVSSPVKYDVTVDNTSFVDLPFTDVSEVGGVITYEFTGTNGNLDKTNYEDYRKRRAFSKFSSYLSSSLRKNKGSIMINDLKKSLTDMTVTITDIVGSNKKIDIDTGVTSISNLDEVLIYQTDDEFIVGDSSVSTKETYATTADGVAGKYSKFYTNYNDGIISTGDFFYENLLPSPTSVLFGNDNTITFGTAFSLNIGDKIIIPSSFNNTGVLVVSAILSTVKYEVAQLTVSEYISSESNVFNADDKNYLNMFLDNTSNNLSAIYVDSTSTPNLISDLSKNSGLVVKSQKSNYRQTVEVTSIDLTNPNKIYIDGNRYSEVKLGDFLEAVPAGLGVQRAMTRIVSKKLFNSTTGVVEILCDSVIKLTNLGTISTPDYQVSRFTTVEDYVSTYKGIKLNGFKVKLDSMPDGTEERQNKILQLVAKGKPLFRALTNKDVITFRYVVDSFGLGLTERSKQELVDICGERLDCVGFINMPSIKQFKNSSSPSFINEDGVVSAEHIANGGNLEDSPAFLYSFGDGVGVSSVGYFTPYLTVNDNGRPINVPPASYVATTYLRKLNSIQTNIVPWTIAAGITNGLVTNISGLEINYTPTDIEFLNLAQINPIVFKRNRGFMIETENTAQKLSKSALSFIHVREVLVELEKELSAMLLEFQWKFNTPDIRAEIKLRADAICERFVNRNGLFDFFNKIDEENNTSEIIDNQIGVLDTFCEPIKGMGVIVNNITILGTNAISSGGFQAL